MHFTIVEDDAQERDRLEEFARRFCQEKHLSAEITMYQDGQSFLEEYPAENRPDILFMDIEMPGLTGMETARRLREIDAQVQLIFITFMVQYAIEGYSVDAADFIPKPVNYVSFSAHLDRVLSKIRQNSPRFLTTSYAKQALRINVQQICYIESLHKKTILHLIDGTTQFSTDPLYTLEEKLQEEAFFRCHNAYLVNLAYVKSMDSSNALVADDMIPISKYRKKEFLQKLTDYRGRMF